MPQTARVLTHQQAKAFYDWMGTKSEPHARVYVAQPLRDGTLDTYPCTTSCPGGWLSALGSRRITPSHPLAGEVCSRCYRFWYSVGSGCSFAIGGLVASGASSSRTFFNSVQADARHRVAWLTGPGDAEA
jgi:hypothetical protein